MSPAKSIFDKHGVEYRILTWASNPTFKSLKSKCGENEIPGALIGGQGGRAKPIRGRFGIGECRRIGAIYVAIEKD